MLRDVELPVLRGFLTSSEAAAWKQNLVSTADVGSLLHALLDGDLEAVLLSPQVLELLGGDGSVEDGEGVEAYLTRRLLGYLDDAAEDERVKREVVVLVMVVACVHLFVQSNWTGPPVSINVHDLLPAALLTPFAQARDLTEALHSSLLLDGEAVYSLVANPFLLLLARVALLRCSSKMESLQLLAWWTLRYVSLHQQILEERSTQLLSLAHNSMEQVLKCEALFMDKQHRHLAVQFHLECVYTHLTYYDNQPAKEHVQKAQELSGLNISMTGALGKRTNFQQNFLAQLILDVNRKEGFLEPAEDLGEASLAPTPLASLPKIHELTDDTVLNHVSLAEPERHQLPDLSAVEQAVVLAVCVDYQKNNPLHRLTEEELLAFTSCILSQPKFWAVEVAALCLRTKLERGSSRRVERAMMQTQAIVDHFDDNNCPVTERLKVFYCCQAPPRWTLQKQLASLLIDLGCVSSALLMYEKLELWEDAVVCYERMGQHGKAEEILRRELEKKETPTLYCLLGDVLRAHQHYDRAWELSGRHSARAMRSKALLHLRNKDFQQCVDCFEMSLRVNAIQLGVWFSLGCAYFALEGYEGAARAFQRCVGLEPDNAEAWNNLSTAYIRLQQKSKAFRTLQEALKCNYDCWQIWENFVVVSVDIGEFGEAIKAYHRLMDLREKYKDVQLLEILVRAAVEDLPDPRGQGAAALRPQLRELLGRATARHSTDAPLWQQYALLYGSGRSSQPEDNEKALQFLSKAHRCEVQLSGWDKDPSAFKEVIQRAVDMGQVTISCSRTKSNSQEALQMLSSTRLSLRSLATRAKQTHTDAATGQVPDDLRDGLAQLEQLIAELQEMSGRLRGQ